MDFNSLLRSDLYSVFVRLWTDRGGARAPGAMPPPGYAPGGGYDLCRVEDRALGRAGVRPGAQVGAGSYCLVIHC